MIFNICNRELSVRLASIFTILVIILSALSPINVNGQLEDDYPVEELPPEDEFQEEEELPPEDEFQEEEELPPEDEFQEEGEFPPERFVEEAQATELLAAEECDNGVDDDGDGLVDGEDGDCPAQAPPEPAEVCDNGVDDDGDGLVDGDDSDCPPSALPAPAEVCDNGVDDDGDGLVDGDDSDCPPSALPAPAEVCDNGVDDDVDGLVDGEDEECAATTPAPCPDNGNTTGCPTNLSPIANAGKSLMVNANQSVTLDGTASSDPDGNITSFQWVQTRGEPTITLKDSNTATPSFIAPVVSNETRFTFELTIMDDNGGNDKDSVDILVNASTTADFNTVPKVLHNQTLNASLVDSESGKTYGVKLLSYSVGDSIVDIDELDNDVDFLLNNSAKVKIVPTSPDTRLEVTGMTLLANEGTNTYLNRLDEDQWELDSPSGVHSLIIDAKYSPGDGEAHYGALIEVTEKETLPPIANAGEDQVVSGNVTVTLDGTKSADPDGDISSYQWLQINEEPFLSVGGVDTSKPSFISPSNLGKDTNVTFRLIVTDNNGANDTDDVSILIKNTTLPKVEGNVVLEPIPSTMTVGQFYEFKGTLNLSKIPDGSYVQIRNGNGEDTDELITLGDVGSTGEFIAGWTVFPHENMLSIYAAYEDVSGNIFRSETFPLKVEESKSDGGIAEQSYSTSTSRPNICNLKPCIEIFFNDWDKDFLNLYIVAIDSHSIAYLDDAKKAVQELTESLQRKTGTSKWNFKYFPFIGTPSDLQFATHPRHIQINLQEFPDATECGKSWPAQRKDKNEGFVLNHVVTRGGCDVNKSTKHELIHSLGIGHTWNEGNAYDKTRDMMCSVDYNIVKSGALTCQDEDYYKDNHKPTEFNLRALVHVYYNNGFEQPNNASVIEDYNPRNNYKYYCNPLPCEPSANQYKVIPKEKIRGDDGGMEKINVDKDKEVSEKGNKDVLKKEITKNAKLLKLKFKWGSFGDGIGQFNKPADIAFDSANREVYVSDLGNNRIEKFDAEGNFILSWGIAGKRPGQFNQPGDISVDSEGKFVYVADIGNSRIQKFDTNGKYIDGWGSLGEGNGQFDHPGDIAIGANDRIIYITDIGNARVQKFDSKGNFLLKWGSVGTGNEQFNRPAGISYDPTENIVYVLDTMNNRVQKFDSNGKFLGKWGLPGKGNGQFNDPTGISHDLQNDLIFITDNNNKRIQVLDKDGNFVTKWGSKVNFDRPTGIAYDADSQQIYINDKSNHNVQVLQHGP